MKTKKDIVKSIADELNITQVAVKRAVQMTFDSIIDTLVVDGRIELRNFGVFEVKRRQGRKARNPRTGQEVFVPPRNVVTFKPGKIMNDRVLAAVLKPGEDKPVPPPPPPQP